MIYLEVDREFAPYVLVNYYINGKKFEIVADEATGMWYYVKKVYEGEKESRIKCYKKPKVVSKIFRASYF